MKVLFADFHSQSAIALEAALVAQDLEVQRPGAAERLADAVQAHAPDLVILAMGLPDHGQLSRLHEIALRLPVLLFVDEDDERFMAAAIAAGVTSYILLGDSLPEIRPIIGSALALFQRIRTLEADLRQAEAELEDRKLVDKAKLKLMRQCSIDEAEAYRRLRKWAMDQGRRIPAIAAEILKDPA